MEQLGLDLVPTLDTGAASKWFNPPSHRASSILFIFVWGPAQCLPHRRPSQAVRRMAGSVGFSVLFLHFTKDVSANISSTIHSLKTVLIAKPT